MLVNCSAGAIASYLLPRRKIHFTVHISSQSDSEKDVLLSWTWWGVHRPVYDDFVDQRAIRSAGGCWTLRVGDDNTFFAHILTLPRNVKQLNHAKQFGSCLKLENKLNFLAQLHTLCCPMAVNSQFRDCQQRTF